MEDLLVWVIASMICLAALFALIYFPQSISCDTRATKMGMKYSYGLVQGCMVQVQGRWIPIESYRVVD